MHAEDIALPSSPEQITESVVIQDSTQKSPKMFRVHIDLDCALHLPPEPAKHTVEPTTYVSFEAFAPSEDAAPMATVYTTNIIENTSSPQWNKQYQVLLPVDYLLDVSYIKILIKNFSRSKLLSVHRISNDLFCKFGENNLLMHHRFRIWRMIPLWAWHQLI